MEITEHTPPSKMTIKLDFIEPFATSNTTVFALQPQADGTLVTWTMTGPVPFMSKLMTVFVSMDAMIGPDFEKGLAQLKEVAEK
jgi:sorbitol-specific phosphotransferase system component IIC